MEEGELGTVQFLFDDYLLRTNCIGQIAPLETPKIFGLHPRVTFSTRIHLDPRDEDSSTISTRTRGIPRNAGTFSGPVLVSKKGARRSAHGQSTNSI